MVNLKVASSVIDAMEAARWFLSEPFVGTNEINRRSVRLLGIPTLK